MSRPMANSDFRIVPNRRPIGSCADRGWGRHIHTGDAEIYRSIVEIVEELKTIEAEAKEADKALDNILRQLGVGP